MTRFEVLSDTHTVVVVDYDKERRYSFSKNHSYDGEEISIQGLAKVKQTTKEFDSQARELSQFNGIQDVPTEVLDFLDREGYHTDAARRSHQL